MKSKLEISETDMNISELGMTTLMGKNDNHVLNTSNYHNNAMEEISLKRRKNKVLSRNKSLGRERSLPSSEKLTYQVGVYPMKLNKIQPLDYTRNDESVIISSAR